MNIHSKQTGRNNSNVISGKMDYKLSYFHAMEYYSPVNINEVVIHATTWKNFKNMLRERRHT